MIFGRDESEWDVLAAAGEEFLIERARLGRYTSYTELNARSSGAPASAASTLNRRLSGLPWDTSSA